jgi:aspartate kinase
VIVMKFGGTSIADAERIANVAGIVQRRVTARPMVVVSALGGVTDLLERAIAHATHDELTKLDSLLAEIERRHRWALSGSALSSRVRHHLNLELDGMFEDLRLRLRAMRILGEVTPRTEDAVLACGEIFAARLVATVFAEAGLPADWVDARDVMITDDCFGQAVPLPQSIAERCDARLAPLLERGRIPVLGGYMGATLGGETTTLGRGGSDRSAAIFGLALHAEEIEIWTDVSGLMTADPCLVPGARALDRLSFAEATELAFNGARVLHPDSLAPAVAAEIPVRVLNSLQPELPGTVLYAGPPDVTPRELASITSRRGICVVRIIPSGERVDSGFSLRAMQALEALELTIDLAVTSDRGLTLVRRGEFDADRLRDALGRDASIQLQSGCALICFVGAGLLSGKLRGDVLQALAAWNPEIVLSGASRVSLSAVIEESRLEEALGSLHGRFFERSSVT